MSDYSHATRRDARNTRNFNADIIAASEILPRAIN